MGLMNNTPMQPFTAPNSLGLGSNVDKAVWYPLHEDSGSSAAGALGLGPALTLNGTEGTFWSATWGSATPDGSTHRLSSPANDTYLNALGDLTSFNGKEILVGWDLEHDGAMSASETLMTWGVLSTGAGVGGGWRIQMSSATQVTITTHAGEGATTAAFGFPASTTGGYTGRMYSVLSLVGTGATSVEATLHRYQDDGTGLLLPTTLTAWDMLANGGSAAPRPTAISRLTLFAAMIGSATYNAYMGATAGSNAKVNNVWVARLNARQAGTAEQALADMVLSKREFPRSLRAAS